MENVWGIVKTKSSVLFCILTIPDRKITLLLPFKCTSLRSGLLYYRKTFYIVFSPIMSPTRPLNVAGKMFYHYYNFTIKETLKKIISAIKSILKHFQNIATVVMVLGLGPSVSGPCPVGLYWFQLCDLLLKQT